MARDRERRYWDSFCFLALLNNEEPYASKCAQILEEAKKDIVELVISPLTMAETVRPKGAAAPIPVEQQERIADFFENDYMRFRVIDRLIAKRKGSKPDSTASSWSRESDGGCQAGRLSTVGRTPSKEQRNEQSRPWRTANDKPPRGKLRRRSETSLGGPSPT